MRGTDLPGIVHTMWIFASSWMSQEIGGRTGQSSEITEGRIGKLFGNYITIFRDYLEKKKSIFAFEISFFKRNGFYSS